MISEITVIVKDDEKKLQRKELCHEEFKVSLSDALLARLIHDVTEEFKGEPTDVQIRIKVTV